LIRRPKALAFSPITHKGVIFPATSLPPL
jgi:hypothetical protein